MATATFEDRCCPVKDCDGWCHYHLKGAPAVSTNNMSKQSFDVTVGKDAAQRWEKIKARQEVRNKVRQETGEKALIATSHESYRTLPGTKLREVVIPESAQGSIVTISAK